MKKIVLMTAFALASTGIAQAQTAAPAPADVPVCSKTVTDKCVNSTAKVVHRHKVIHKKTTTVTKTQTKG